jgi:alpha-beta hydrolase superfamily lysophospholipase
LDVSLFFNGAATPTSIFALGNSLLNSLEANRQSNPKRPIIFIVHSLGGSILKEALYRSSKPKTISPGLQKLNGDIRELLDGNQLRTLNYNEVLG